jgi:hypothetical protein
MQGVQLMKRIYVNLTDEQAAALKQRAVETGVLQVEQIRRAINLSLFADSQRRPKTAAILVAQR